MLVACYFWGDKYQPEDVRRLRRMVQRHLHMAHEFAVITDQPELFADDDGMRVIALDQTTHVEHTCFVKLMTFHPAGAAMFGERMLVIDLDTLIVGDMTPLVRHRSRDLVLWRNPCRIPWDDELNPRPYYNTSILLHRCGTMPQLWQRFNPYNPLCRDDQWWVSHFVGSDCAFWDAHDGIYRLARSDTPGSGVNGVLPANARVVTFPGSEGKWTDPAIRAANPWINEHLRAA